jgi:hypothetical protein
MSIPLDRLYHFVDSLSGGDIIIYRFNPHGSKKITDLYRLKYFDALQDSIAHHMICHDQEPLSYSYYSDPDRLQELRSCRADSFLTQYDQDRIKELTPWLVKKNIKLGTDTRCCVAQYALLLHSEQNSQQLDTYQRSGFIGVYWWSHAVIAGDWFRYAKHDPDLEQKNISRDFLIYNRAWSGTREYRLKFAELVVQQDLQDHTMMRFNPNDNGQHYRGHVYHNPAFTVDTPLEDYFELNTHDATASADYASADYISTGIEVVLETLFDDTRWHLTEKILRPIACGQPFVLAATPGSLQYLRDYGFRTFSPLINETYDTLQDPVARLEAITLEMRRIADMPTHEKQSLFGQLREIAQHNRRWFFSQEFHDSITQEFQNNLAQARHRLQGS